MDEMYQKMVKKTTFIPLVAKICNIGIFIFIFIFTTTIYDLQSENYTLMYNVNREYFLIVL